MFEINLQLFGGRGSGGGRRQKEREETTAENARKSLGRMKKVLEKATKSEVTGTMSANKSSEQVSNEVEQLRSIPSGSVITRMVNGKPVDYVAHDEARMGRNGRMLRRRVFSQITSGGKNLPFKTSDTTDPYYVAQGQWEVKKKKK